MGFSRINHPFLGYAYLWKPTLNITSHPLITINHPSTSNHPLTSNNPCLRLGPMFGVPFGLRCLLLLVELRVLQQTFSGAAQGGAARRRTAAGRYGYHEQTWSIPPVVPHDYSNMRNMKWKIIQFCRKPFLYPILLNDFGILCANSLLWKMNTFNR